MEFLVLIVVFIVIVGVFLALIGVVAKGVFAALTSKYFWITIGFLTVVYLIANAG